MGPMIPKTHMEDVISKLLKLTEDFDPSVRDSSVRSIKRLKFFVPRAMKGDVNNALELYE